ncbi:MAG: GNAT family N-acetyltransferase [Fibrobacteres bacterium]|nr:GNAT family N-acetyltransferase [Fibrobacterota bacterium]
MDSFEISQLLDPDLASQLRLTFQIAMSGPLSPTDQNAFVRTNREYFEKGFTEGFVVFFVAKSLDEIAGCVVLQELRMPPNMYLPSGRYGLVMNMHVYDKFRRIGIGERLMREIEDEARRRHMDRIDLKATEMGESLYRKLGWSEPRGGKSMELYL